jgi:hypothetical protein
LIDINDNCDDGCDFWWYDDDDDDDDDDIDVALWLIDAIRIWVWAVVSIFAFSSMC